MCQTTDDDVKFSTSPPLLLTRLQPSAHKENQDLCRVPSPSDPGHLISAVEAKTRSVSTPKLYGIRASSYFLCLGASSRDAVCLTLLCCFLALGPFEKCTCSLTNTTKTLSSLIPQMCCADSRSKATLTELLCRPVPFAQPDQRTCHGHRRTCTQ